MTEIQIRYILSNKRVILLIGETGSGKSTVGNCVINHNASVHLIRNYPFNTHKDAQGCTDKPTMAFNDGFVVIDTVGFADPKYNASVSYEMFAQALRLVNNRVDLVLLVSREGRITKQTTDVYNFVSSHLFRELLSHNSAYVCSRCANGWISKNRRKNEHLDAMLRNCGDKSIEFSLQFFEANQLEEQPDASFLKYFEADRLNAITKLVTYLRGIPTVGINMDYVQTEKFKIWFIEKLKELKEQSRVQPLEMRVLQLLSSMVPVQRLKACLCKQPAIRWRLRLVKGSLFCAKA